MTVQESGGVADGTVMVLAQALTTAVTLIVVLVALAVLFDLAEVPVESESRPDRP